MSISNFKFVRGWSVCIIGVMFPLHHKLCSIWLVPVHCWSTYFHFSRPNTAWAKSSEKYPSSQILRGTKQNELWLPTLTTSWLEIIVMNTLFTEVFLSSQTYVSGRNDDFLPPTLNLKKAVHLIAWVYPIQRRFWPLQTYHCVRFRKEKKFLYLPYELY